MASICLRRGFDSHQLHLVVENKIEISYNFNKGGFIMDDKEKRLAEIRRLQNEIEGNRKGMNMMAAFSVVSVAVACIGWVCEMTILLLLGIFALFICIWLYLQCQSGIKQFEVALSRARSDFDSHSKAEERAKQLRQAERLRQEEIEGAKYPQCPNCGSLQTKRITTANRAASVYMVGLASDKIGKQFECPVCKYKW